MDMAHFSKILSTPVYGEIDVRPYSDDVDAPSVEKKIEPIPKRIVENRSCSTKLSFAVFESLDELVPLTDQIDLLASCPFLKTSWMFSWIKTYCDSNCKLHFVLARNDNQEVVGFAPLVLLNSLKRGRYFAFVGSGKACSDYMTFPAQSDYRSEFIQGMAEWLTSYKGWDRIELDGVRSDDENINEFSQEMKKRACKIEEISTLSSWRMNLPESWEDLLSGFSKNYRKKYRRLERKLEGKTELHRAIDGDSLKEGLAILEQLHTKRWESLGGGGCFSHPGFRDFLKELAWEKLDSDALSLIWLTYEGTPVAADIAYYGDGDDVVYTYQGGISPDHLHLEPGRAILKCQIELAIEKGAKFVDFLRGDEPCKARFNTFEIKNSRFEIVNPSIRAKCVHLMLNFCRMAKSFVPKSR